MLHQPLRSSSACAGVAPLRVLVVDDSA
ncbi:MAG: hypothetical protein RL260_2894, partial [Pseudomonadota bacterium]